MRARIIAAGLMMGIALGNAGIAGGQTIVPKPPEGAPSQPADRYDKEDWSALPPWKQTNFWGVRAKGQVFVFVIDVSGSMGDQARLVRAKAELRRTVRALKYPQRFLVIVHNEEPRILGSGTLLLAGPESSARLDSWLRTVDADGGTDPRAAMQMALGLNPDAVFLLSDGEYPKGSAETIAKANRFRVPVHCVDLSGGASGSSLKRIAGESGGQYAPRR